MRFSKFLLSAAAITAFLILGTLPSQAQAPGDHPRYLRALSNLRLTRAYLDRLTPNEVIDQDSQRAIVEIDAAMREIRHAAIDDGQPLSVHPPIDARITPTDRFHKAREAANAAWVDINHEEDNEFARGLKRRALTHIEEAIRIVDLIIRRIDRR
ncbi:MAG: hypothetical protein WCE75_02080 [Terracidiphilus sp.]